MRRREGVMVWAPGRDVEAVEVAVGVGRCWSGEKTMVRRKASRRDVWERGGEVEAAAAAAAVAVAAAAAASRATTCAARSSMR